LGAGAGVIAAAPITLAAFEIFVMIFAAVAGGRGSCPGGF